MEAIYLLACHFASRFYPALTLGRYEAHFLARARKALENSLSYSDRLFDFVRGSTLVSWYLFSEGRFIEG